MRIGLIFVGLLAIAGLAVLLGNELGLGPKEKARPQVTVRTPAAEPAKEAPTPPTFDVVRVEPTGEAVAAGRAEPGAEVRLLIDGETVATVGADARGEWTIVLEKPLEPGARELTLVEKLPDGREIPSDQSVIVVLAEREGAPLVVRREDGEASRVLQSPGGAAPASSLTLSAIDYDGRGNVILSGGAGAGSRVKVLLDGSLEGIATADEGGWWSLKLGDLVPPGAYRLRLDEIDGAGALVARIELPFEREDPANIVIGDGRVVVQPGNTLWRIARKAYGAGIEYTIIFDANRGLIRDPDLIYPGQVFELPPKMDDRIERPPREPVRGTGSGS